MNLGQQLKENGQQMALFNAGTDWKNSALDALRTFCHLRKQVSRPEFLFESFREYALSIGVGEAHHVNAWGSLPKVAAKLNIIAPTDRFTKAERPAAHARMSRVWVAL